MEPDRLEYPRGSTFAEALHAAREAMDRVEVRPTMVAIGAGVAKAWGIEPGFYHLNPKTGEWDYEGPA